MRNKTPSKKELRKAGDAVADMLKFNDDLAAFKDAVKNAKDGECIAVDPEILAAADAIPKRKKRKKYKKAETKLKKNCLIWLNEHGIAAWPRNTGAYKIGNSFIRYGKVGSADIEGLLPDGRHLEIETKSKTGVHRNKQKDFQKMIERNNGLYLLIRSVSELEFWLKANKVPIRKG